MNTVRMRIVERVLERVIADRLKFDMTVWTDPVDTRRFRRVYDDCETAACAAGWTARDPEAISQGLYVNQDTGEPCTAGRWGMGAMAGWLDVEFYEAARIFSPAAYSRIPSPTPPEEVLERVREILRDPPPPPLADSY